MTTFTVIRRDGKIIKFYGHGHTGHASTGEDIVCAAISASTQQTAFGILNYLHVPCHLGQNDETGFLYLDLDMQAEGSNKSLKEYNELIDSKRDQLDALLETMVIMLREIEKEYPNNLEIIEKEDKE
jgi:hypothetical protein